MDEKNNATTVSAYQKDALDEKVVAAFPGKIVRKDLTAQMKQGFGVPTFVLEYLLGMYCATDDEAAAAEGLERIRKILTENFVRPDESEAVKSRIRERGRHTVIDRLSAVLDEREDIYVGTLASLKIDPFVVPDRYVREYTKMLTGGIWCILSIEYVHGLSDGSPRKGGKRSPQDSPFQIVSITPIQMPNLDLDELCRSTTWTAEFFARSRGIEVVYSGPEEPVWIGADRVMMEILLLNLISNSLLHLREGGRLEVSLTRRGGRIVLAVDDTGSGMTQQELSSLFTGGASGQGMGLRLVRDIAELHGGAFIIEGREGRGASARVMLQSDIRPGSGIFRSTGVSEGPGHMGIVLVQLATWLSSKDYDPRLLD